MGSIVLLLLVLCMVMVEWWFRCLVKVLLKLVGRCWVIIMVGLLVGMFFNIMCRVLVLLVDELIVIRWLVVWNCGEVVCVVGVVFSVSFGVVVCISGCICECVVIFILVMILLV